MLLIVWRGQDWGDIVAFGYYHILEEVGKFLKKLWCCDRGRV